MTEYLKKSFSVPMGGKDFADGWDRIFGSKEGEKAGDFGSSIGEMPVTPDLAIVEEDSDEKKRKRVEEKIRRMGK